MSALWNSKGGLDDHATPSPTWAVPGKAVYRVAPQAKVGPLIANALTGEERELFEGGWGEALSLKEDVVARKTNGVHLGTGVDLKARNWTSQRGVVRPLSLVHQLLRCFHAFIRGILVSTLQGGRL